MPIGRASGSASETTRSVDLLARQTLGDLPGDGRSQLSGPLELPGRGELALRATAPRGRSGLGSQLASLTDRARNQLTGLPSQLENLLTRTARLSQPSPDGAPDQP